MVSYFVCVTAAAAAPEPGAGRWAGPDELRSKKLIDAAIYTLDSSPIPVNSRTLAENPRFTSTHPFDGIAVRALLDDRWFSDLARRVSPARPEEVGDPYLDAFLWSKEPLPREAVASAIADLQRVKWGSLTDNFLWCNFRGGEEALRAEILSESDWAVVERNARLAGRVCTEAKLKGLLFDTEQYTSYPGGKTPFPLGKGTPELRRERGRRWMKALQGECPGIRVIIFFAWSPDLESAGFLSGVKDFLDGMLEAVEAPARLIHGYENTFYYGQRAGTRFTDVGFPGDRARYESTRRTIQGWRSLSREPDRYDRFVEVGMAAWLESDPWNLWRGWPSGTKATIWSNVPMALAAADEYVWCWSEHTNFLHSRVGDEVSNDPQEWLNPYLASVTNQTFNRGDEPSTSLSEDFATDPLSRGWYFDFDMLSVGRKARPSDAAPILSREAVPYVWSPKYRAVLVRETPPEFRAGTDAGSPPHRRQRRRYVHPVAPLSTGSRFEIAFDFTVESFGEGSANPVVLGLFRSDRTLEENSLTLTIQAGGRSTAVLASGPGRIQSSKETVLRSGNPYRAEFRCDGPARRLEIIITDRRDRAFIAKDSMTIPAGVVDATWNEIGVALRDGADAGARGDALPRYRLERVKLDSDLSRK